MLTKLGEFQQVDYSVYELFQGLLDYHFDYLSEVLTTKITVSPFQSFQSF